MNLNQKKEKRRESMRAAANRMAAGGGTDFDLAQLSYNDESSCESYNWHSLILNTAKRRRHRGLNPLIIQIKKNGQENKNEQSKTH